MKKTCIALGLASVSSFAIAEDAPKNWSGEGELGYTANSTVAKTSSESLLAKLGIKYKQDKLGNLFNIENIRTESTVNDTETVSADRLIVRNKTTYDFNDAWYGLVNLSHEDDKLSAYDYVNNYTAGLGWHAIASDTTKLDFELGAGTFEAKLESGDTESDTAGRFFESLSHKFTESTSLTQSYLAESAEDNVKSTFDIGLKVLMSKAMTLKVSQQYKNNSKLPKEFDRTSNVTVIYGF